MRQVEEVKEKPILLLLVSALFIFFPFISLRFASAKLEGEIYDVLPRDAIRAILRPGFADKQEEKAYSDSERVIGLEINGDARAYPTVILSRHEIANDVVGNVPVVVTWCPLCNTAIVYKRTVKRRTLTFGVSGKLYFNDLVMYDLETSTLWSQVTGEAIQGPLNGTVLEMLPALLTTWGEWKLLYPNAHILSKIHAPAGSYDRDLYENYYKDPNRLGVRPTRFDSYPNVMPKDFVVGIRIGTKAKAYPCSALKSKKTINDIVAGVPLLVVYREASKTAMVFRRTQGGKPLTFEWFDDTESGLRLKDSETGSTWDGLTGEAIEGRLKGSRLQRLPATHAYWFAWKDFFPDTQSYL